MSRRSRRVIDNILGGLAQGYQAGSELATKRAMLQRQQAADERQMKMDEQTMAVRQQALDAAKAESAASTQSIQQVQAALQMQPGQVDYAAARAPTPQEVAPLYKQEASAIGALGRPAQPQQMPMARGAEPYDMSVLRGDVLGTAQQASQNALSNGLAARESKPDIRQMEDPLFAAKQREALARAYASNPKTQAAAYEAMNDARKLREEFASQQRIGVAQNLMGSTTGGIWQGPAEVGRLVFGQNALRADRLGNDVVLTLEDGSVTRAPAAGLSSLMMSDPKVQAAILAANKDAREERRVADAEKRTEQQLIIEEGRNQRFLAGLQAMDVRQQRQLAAMLAGIEAREAAKDARAAKAQGGDDLKELRYWNSTVGADKAPLAAQLAKFGNSPLAVQDVLVNNRFTPDNVTLGADGGFGIRGANTNNVVAINNPLAFSTQIQDPKDAAAFRQKIVDQRIQAWDKQTPEWRKVWPSSSPEEKLAALKRGQLAGLDVKTFEGLAGLSPQPKTRGFSLLPTPQEVTEEIKNRKPQQPKTRDAGGLNELGGIGRGMGGLGQAYAK